MAEKGNVLISLEKKHAENILSGKKHVELRRRSMDIEPDTVIWIYVKKPLGAVVGYARVVDGYSYAPSTLWNKFSKVSGLTRQEFFSYFNGVSKGFALALTEAERLPRPITLESLRKGSDGFHPPQFFMRLTSDDRVLRLLQKAGKRDQLSSDEG